MGAFKRRYKELMDALQKGAAVPGNARVQIDEGTTNLRTRMINYLKSIYNGIPQWSQLLRQTVAEWVQVDLSDPKAYISSRFIQIPK